MRVSDKQYGINVQRNTRACLVLVLCCVSFLSDSVHARGSRYRETDEALESVEDEAPASDRRGSSVHVERFELVAEDASVPGSSSLIANNWGLHQPRITRHSNGVIRLLYLTQTSSDALTWRLMHRTPGGEWGQEASGSTTDDVALLRDARTDRVHVLAWPKSVPTVFTSPTFNGAAIPGAWQKLPASSRHYGNAGIGPDGTVCLKVSRELPGETTARTHTEYACGNFSSASRKWRWGEMVKNPTGARHVHDYIFPNPAGLPKGLYATSTSDVHKTVLGGKHAPAVGNYVFNGIRVYSSGLDSAQSWKHVDTHLPVGESSRKKIMPTFRLQEGLIDSKGRIFSSYYIEDPEDKSMRGLYVTVNNRKGDVLFESKWKKLPGYGFTRLFEDGRGRLWLVWAAQGTRRTEVHLYRVKESTGDELSFSLGNRIDLSEAFAPYVIQGNLYLAVPRGGNGRSQFIDAIFNACSATYASKADFDGKRCYGSKRSVNGQQVFYTRIRLPG